MKFRFTIPRKLREAGILSINNRNSQYIMPYNHRKFFPLVDNKVLTKKYAVKHGVATAGIIGVIKHHYQVADLEKIVRRHQEFVIKPATGSGGRGITVVCEHDNEHFVLANGDVINMRQIRQHVFDTLSGLYSLGGQPDWVLIEEKINFSEELKDYSYRGVPDARIIIFKGYPVMAMLRLATRKSAGRANLHQGAVGVGISVKDGRALAAVADDKPVTHHPDNGKHLHEILLPRWDEHLEIAVRCHEMLKLGYLGADIAMDRDRGPLMLEVNVRPGLAIQIANHTGLRPRLELIESLSENAHSGIEERIAFSRENFD
ncbi:alpha-L-glutamate ligase-like protein [Lentisphaerota bacterium ZTH]|nr:alpha-L-glutamate ligase-like protein [Lentisphaerota bacterium]WET06761.1 alpha-L-glutamate ligase-like protein [Lentisphaerota bacterium ZTH]